jgi:hypothetical protein
MKSSVRDYETNWADFNLCERLLDLIRRFKRTGRGLFAKTLISCEMFADFENALGTLYVSGSSGNLAN